MAIDFQNILQRSHLSICNKSIFIL